MNKTLDELKQQLTAQQNTHFEIEILLRRTVYLFEQSKEAIYLLKQAIKQKKRETRKAQRQARKIARENRRAAKSINNRFWPTDKAMAKSNLN